MFKRFRRLRLNETLKFSSETTLTLMISLYPLFVREEMGIKTKHLQCQVFFQMSIDEILKECEYLVSINLKSIIFICYSWCKRLCWKWVFMWWKYYYRTIKAIKAKFPQMFIVTDFNVLRIYRPWSLWNTWSKKLKCLLMTKHWNFSSTSISSCTSWSWYDSTFWWYDGWNYYNTKNCFRWKWI